MARYRFSKAMTAEEVLKAIGRTDIPSTQVVIRMPAVDETGEVIADMEIDLGPYTLTASEETLLETRFRVAGYSRLPA
jgi:hypothetical protein